MGEGGSDATSRPRPARARGHSSTLHSIAELERHLERSRSLRGLALQGLELGGIDVDWSELELEGAFALLHRP